jgi:hypothetical protein
MLRRLLRRIFEIRNRIFWAIGVGVALIAIAIELLSVADRYASDASTYCSVNLWLWQWLGCAMAAHEGLAAGLIGAAGALFAGWLAFTAVQEQMRQEQSRELRTNRPWLFLKGATIRRRETPYQAITPNYWFIKLHWRNVGRSPAIVERCEFKLVDKSIITAHPDYSNSLDLITPAMIPQDGEFETNEFGPAPEAGTKNGEPVQLVLFGRLTYKELSGIIHQTGFALEISPHLAAYVAHPNRAYDYYD